MRAWFCAVALVSACGGGGGIGSGDDAEPDAAVDPQDDGGTQESWTTLIERSWTMSPSTEGYKCVSIQVTEDMYLGALRVKAPIGTHHGILTTSATPFSQSGEYNCLSTDNGMQMLYAAGLGTGDFKLPSGVAIKLTAGTYINLNLHVANYSDSALNGTSGVEVQLVPANKVVHEADMMFLGTEKLNIPPTNQPYVASTFCSIPTTWNVVAMWPHMHSYATHQRVFVRRSSTGTNEDLVNADYSYTDQKNYPMAVKVNPNDQLHIECTYVNNTNVTAPPGAMIQYGESASAEMCLAGFYKYPKGGAMDMCIDQ